MESNEIKKLSDIKPEQIDEIVSLFNIRGVSKIHNTKGIITFHQPNIGWHEFTSDNLNNISGLSISPKGVIYYKVSDSVIWLFKSKSRYNETLLSLKNYICVSHELLSYKRHKKERQIAEWLFQNGFALYRKWFDWGFKSNGTMGVGNWHEEWVAPLSK